MFYVLIKDACQVDGTGIDDDPLDLEEIVHGEKHGLHGDDNRGTLCFEMLNEF